MRLFAGLDLPYEMRRNLELLLHLLKPKARIQWSPVANLHLTTKFIGDFPEERGRTQSGTQWRGSAGALRIALRAGWFPNADRPRVLVASIEARRSYALARDTDAAFARLGLSRKRNRSTAPDAREDPAAEPLFELKKAISELPSVDSGFSCGAIPSLPEPVGTRRLDLYETGDISLNGMILRIDFYFWPT